MAIRRVPRIDYIHTVGFERLAGSSRLLRLAVAKFLSSAAITVTLADELRWDVEPWVARKSVRIIANFVPDATPGNATIEERYAARRVLFMSNLLPEKGVSDFVELAAKFTQNGDPAKFTVVGGDAGSVEFGRLRDSVEAADLTDRIELRGALHGALKEEALSQATLLVFPSSYEFEAQPLSVIEAMAHGVPAVAYNVGALPSITGDHEAGICVPTGNLGALEDAVSFVLGSFEVWSRLSFGALARHEAQFSQSAYAGRWEEAIREVTMRDRRRARGSR
ncbi:MAG: glycosyltransferase [Demequina sp.]